MSLLGIVCVEAMVVTESLAGSSPACRREGLLLPDASVVFRRAAIEIILPLICRAVEGRAVKSDARDLGSTHSAWRAAPSRLMVGGRAVQPVVQSCRPAGQTLRPESRTCTEPRFRCCTHE